MDINAPEAWAWTQGSSDVVIAICGGHVKLTPGGPDPNVYSPDVAGNVWINPGEIPGNNIDDEGNGYVDDIHGWDFDGHGANVEGPPEADRGHGTACAKNAIAAIDNSNLSYSGIGSAPECRFMAVPFYWINSVIYAAENGAAVMSYSYGASGSVYNNAVSDAYKMGMLFCNVAGNPGTPIFDFPPYGISVKHIDQNAVPYAPTGPEIDIATPSTDAASSFAAPIVAGVVALMKSINPNLSQHQLRALLLDPTSVDPYNGIGAGIGRTSALKAIRNASGSPVLKIVAGNPGDHPVIEWTGNNSFPGPSPGLPPVLVEYLIERRREEYENCFFEIATVSASTTSYTDLEEIVGYRCCNQLPTLYRVKGTWQYPTNTVFFSFIQRTGNLHLQWRSREEQRESAFGNKTV